MQERIACVELTEFRDPEARAACSELALVERSEVRDKTGGPLLAKLCIANKTPALLVPGAPPSAQDLQREREYAKHGIEWVITGDVYDGDFERFRDSFHAGIVDGVEAQRGRGTFRDFRRKLMSARSRYNGRESGSLAVLNCRRVASWITLTSIRRHRIPSSKKT